MCVYIYIYIHAHIRRYWFQKCCYFNFGPYVRGLPYSAGGTVNLDVSFVGRLRIWLGTASVGIATLWTPSWTTAQLAADLPGAATLARTGGWDAGAELLQPLRGRALAEASPLRVLDLGLDTNINSI